MALPLLGLASLLLVSGCSRGLADEAAEAPPPARVVPDFNVTAFKVDHPEQFPLATATEHTAPSKLVVTGAVNPDVARTVPVISLATGRIVRVYARLGDRVKKGQLLLSVRSDDIAGGFATYQMAVADELLARAQYERAQDLHQHGAMALNDLQIAKDAEDKAKIAVAAAEEHLRLLGSDVAHPSGLVEIHAPVSGVITDQQVTTAAGVQSLGTNPFTISDLSYVWIVCDVYENEVAGVEVGDEAEITLNAYPGKVLKGTVSNIGVTLDPSLRTGKVRIEVPNPGLMRLGMFVTATLRGRVNRVETAVPATAVLHLHDRDYVYVPAPGAQFRRVEVVGGETLGDNSQEIRSGR
ncbi:MAG TPA: efflux RND transporter periplasmic adaptor subunit, partial [Acidobacteriaceae bacterium]